MNYYESKIAGNESKLAELAQIKIQESYRYWFVLADEAKTGDYSMGTLNNMVATFIAQQARA